MAHARTLFLPAAAILGCLLSGPAAMAQSTAAAPATVLELFTSQGCSVCPPADAIFSQYAKRADVLALTFNVDYWDYLGWKDTLATADNTDRQKQYAAARGDMQVYTPQVVVDGRSHVIGSDPKQVDKAIAANANLLTVPLTLKSSVDAITVSVADFTQPDLPHATLWLVMYNPTVSVPVEKGENGGKTLTYSNVVRKLRPIAMWKGKSLSVDIPMSELTHSKAIRGAIILQIDKGDGMLGTVIGAATIDIPVPPPASTPALPATPGAPRP